MATGSHLKVQRMGDDVLGVELLGDKRKPEPTYFRVVFPGGDIDLARLDDGSYWVHLRVNRPTDNGFPDRQFARIADARLDITDKHASECNAGDFANPNLYHVALRVVTDGREAGIP